MPIKIDNSFSPTTLVGSALNNAITSYYNNTPTYGEVQQGRVEQNKADAPKLIGERIRALYGNSGGTGQPLTPQMVQDQIGGLAEASAMGGDVGKLGEMLRTVVANSANPETTQMIDRAQQGAGQAYATTQTGFNKAQDNEILKTKMQQDGANYRANISSKATAATAKEAEKLKGKQGFESVLTDLNGLYDQLDKNGGAVNTKHNALENIGARMANSERGQVVGQFLGTENQSVRNQIAAKLPLLSAAIKNATGMSSQQLNSNFELQQYMKALTSPGNDVQANRKIITGLSKQMGTGDLAGLLAGGGEGATGVDNSGNNNSAVVVNGGGDSMRKVIDGVNYVNHTGQPEDWEEE